MNKPKLRIGLIGYGYWGTNLLRNLVGHPAVNVSGVVETSDAQIQRCQRLYPHLRVFKSLDECLSATPLDAMVIATDPSTHADLALRCLNAGAHVLVEKPLALSSHDCDRVLTTAKAKGRVVMVDHTFVYHPAVQCLSRLKEGGDLGELLYFDSVRVNLGGFQPRANVLWDLAPHDLSILDLLTGGALPAVVSGHGVCHFDPKIENLCYIHLQYASNFVAHLHLNWAAPVKVRQIVIGGTKKMVTYDDNLPAEKIKIYDKGIQFTKDGENVHRVNYRVGEMTAPVVLQTEALSVMVDQFVKTVSAGAPCLSDGDAGCRIVQILEACSESIRSGGKPVKLADGLRKTSAA